MTSASDCKCVFLEAVFADHFIKTIDMSHHFDALGVLRKGAEQRIAEAISDLLRHESAYTTLRSIDFVHAISADRFRLSLQDIDNLNTSGMLERFLESALTSWRVNEKVLDVARFIEEDAGDFCSYLDRWDPTCLFSVAVDPDSAIAVYLDDIGLGQRWVGCALYKGKPLNKFNHVASYYHRFMADSDDQASQSEIAFCACIRNALDEHPVYEDRLVASLPQGLLSILVRYPDIVGSDVSRLAQAKLECLQLKTPAREKSTESGLSL